MKTIKHLVFLLLSVFLLSACSSDDELMPTDGDRTPVSFTANVGHLQTRTTSGGDQWEAGDEIGIFMKQAGEDLSSAIENNRKYQTDESGNFKPDGEGEALYWPQDGAVDFIAYYPYRANLSSPYIYTVDVSDQSEPAAIDLLYSNDATGKSRTKDAVALTFKHQLTKVVLNLKGEGLSDDDLAALTVTLTDMPTTAEFSLADGTWSNEGNKAEITPFKVGNGYEAILIPQGAGAKGKMIFKLGNETFSYTITDELEAGNQYTYNVTVTRQGIEVKKGDITDWRPTNAFYQIGDPYPDAENAKGVVYEISNGGHNGKIVSLDEGKAAWSTELKYSKANEFNNGMFNMDIITKIPDWESKFPVFKWVHGKNPPNTDYSNSDAKHIWYLPSINELRSLYLVYANPSFNFNEKLKEVRGEVLSADWYWSSTEFGMWKVCTFDFNTLYQDNANKDNQYRFRCVLAF